AVDVAEELDELGEGLRVEATVFGHALRGPVHELVLGPARLGHPADGGVELAERHLLLEGGEDLLVREVAVRAEEDQRVRGRLAVAHFFSTWPPNPKRMAESTLFWNSSSPRDANRSKSDAVSTNAGTPSSLAAATVQRPSPESETLPPNFSRFGLPTKACAVRSSSQEATTLPRRHTSVMSARLKSY